MNLEDSVRRDKHGHKVMESYTPPADHFHPLGNDFLYVEVAIPFIEPWPARITCLVDVIITFAISVVDVQALCLVVSFGLADMSRNRWQCMLLEVFILLEKLYTMSVSEIE